MSGIFTTVREMLDVMEMSGKCQGKSLVGKSGSETAYC